jgi:hypothetical protein
MTRGRPIRGFFGGLFLGICLDLDLVLGGAVKLESSLLTILPAALIVIFFLLGLWAPIGRRHQPAAKPLPSPLQRATTWPEYAPVEGSQAPRPPSQEGPTSSI